MTQDSAGLRDSAFTAAPATSSATTATGHGVRPQGSTRPTGAHPAAADQVAGPPRQQAGRRVPPQQQPLLPGAWLLRLPGPGAETHFSRWYVSANFAQDVLVLVLELLLVSSFINLRLVQQLACGVPGAGEACTIAATSDLPSVAAAAAAARLEGFAIPAASKTGLGYAANVDRSSTTNNSISRSGTALQQDFQAWLDARLAAPTTRPMYRWLLQQLQEALHAFPCNDDASSYDLLHVVPADVSADVTSSSSSMGLSGTTSSSASSLSSSSSSSSSSSGQQGVTGRTPVRRAAAARGRQARSLWRMQLTWVFKHLYQVSTITQAYAQDWSFMLWSAGLHINLLARLVGMRVYLHRPWLRTLFVAMTRIGMMLGHLVTLHLLRLGSLPGLQLSTTIYFTVGRQRLGLMYLVWKAAGVAKVPCKHQLWLGIVEYVLAVTVMAQADVATHGEVLLRSCGVGAAWLLVYAVPLVLVLRSEGQARMQLLIQQQQR